MDGDLAPVAELSALARRYDAWLMTDDAHGLGVISASSNAGADLKMGNPVEGSGVVWRISLRVAAGDRSNRNARTNLGLLDGATARERGRGDRGIGCNREQSGVDHATA